MNAADDRWTDAPIDPSAYWQHEADLLRKHPGRWRDVRVCEKPRSAGYMARDIREGRIAAFRPAGAFDAKSRAGVVKACYLGEDQRDEHDRAVLSDDALTRATRWDQGS